MAMSKYVLLCVFTLLAIMLCFAQCGLRMAMSDREATAEFDSTGVAIAFGDFTSENIKIHYAETGKKDAPTLCFIHGSPGSWSAYSEYLKDSVLLRKYRMISIDRPGFGASNFGRGISISRQVPVIGKMLEKMANGQPIYIIGHSLGGPTCVKLAADFPKLISGAVLLAASVDPGEELPEKWRPLMKTPPFRWFMPGAFRPSNDELWSFKKDVLEMPADLNKITCPVVIIQGLEDPMVPPGNAYYAQKQLTHSTKVQLIAIPGANHFIPWTRYSIIKDALLHLQ